ncbi:domain found in dishevelled, egl10, and pleckstrin domain containing protein [Acanthamoeba castellanii str. Neff]|uniref:Domain found in dishevelled, egl10, and pleckstrin domain containing protein n=1 Tax=Acanthamoeba castellanii (strain ATCC 30010 / Neff) TaxID=1257118 RepID=L8GDW4_ACACF|nr:domain found in dishevelled, egl10, and pleckstrin domain containing protein [Acanthamoeba castellanii str. Neff]ELR11039.1 domain found in dishevelled, egl10, and pleckstrin domain containing protein [Acanthamoeba castellanii str. Neff]
MICTAHTRERITTKQKLRTHKNCFVGSEFVDWLVVNRRAKTRAEGASLAQQMFLQKLISSDSQFEDKKGLYRFFGGDGNFSPVSSPTVAPHEPFPEDDGDDELDQLYPYMVAEIEAKSRKDFENKTHKNCFVATQAVDWLMKNRHRAMTNDQALELAEKLRQKGYIKWVGRKTKKISISGPMSSPQAVAAATAVAGPPFEDDDSYYVFEKKSTNRSSKRGK